MQKRRDETNFADGIARQILGRAQQLLNAVVASRDGAADLAQRHFQRGQCLRSCFVEFAAHAALLVAAHLEQLVRQATKVRGRVRFVGYIPNDADDANDFAGIVGDWSASTDHLADGTIRTRVLIRKTKGHGAADGFREFSTQTAGVFEMRQRPEVRGLLWGHDRRQAIEAESFGRPVGRLGCEVGFPHSHFRDFRGVADEGGGGPQADVGKLAAGHVLHVNDDP